MAKKTGNRGMKRLRDEQQVRQRPGVIFGTNDEQGALNGINEIDRKSTRLNSSHRL